MATIRSLTIVEEVLDFLAFIPSLEQIIAFHPSESMQERLRDLLDRNRNGTLTAEENAELDEMERMNHFMVMLKARVRNHL